MLAMERSGTAALEECLSVHKKRRAKQDQGRELQAREGKKETF